MNKIQDKIGINHLNDVEDETLINIKYGDNEYVIMNRLPRLNELSIYVNKDNTIVSNEQLNDDFRHVNVNSANEKIKIAFKSEFVYYDNRIEDDPITNEIRYVRTKIKPKW